MDGATEALIISCASVLSGWGAASIVLAAAGSDTRGKRLAAFLTGIATTALIMSALARMILL